MDKTHLFSKLQIILDLRRNSLACKGGTRRRCAKSFREKTKMELVRMSTLTDRATQRANVGFMYSLYWQSMPKDKINCQTSIRGSKFLDINL